MLRLVRPAISHEKWFSEKAKLPVILRTMQLNGTLLKGLSGRLPVSNLFCPQTQERIIR
jgi:hypothetical protein